MNQEKVKREQCNVKFCTSKATRRGMCGKHYQRLMRGNEIEDPAPGFKRCTKCGKHKELSSFYKGRSECKECGAEYKLLAKESGKLEVWRKNSDKNRRKSKREFELQKKYGLTPEQYEDLLNRQNGCCAICKQKPKTYICVDHCHTSKRVRGLLCSTCNTALGLLNDNLELLENAIQYLRLATEKQGV